MQKKQVKKMCAIFCKAYNLSYVNGRWKIVTPTTTNNNVGIVFDNSNNASVNIATTDAYNNIFYSTVRAC